MSVLKEKWQKRLFPKRKDAFDMKRNDFVNILTEICKHFYVSGQIVKQDNVAGYSLSEQGQEACCLLAELAMKTDYFADVTKTMLENGYSYRRVAESMGKKKVNTVKSKIYNDISKLKKKLGENAFDKIVRDRNVDLSDYIGIVESLLEKNKKKSLLEGFAFKLPPCPSELKVEQLSENDMMRLRYFVTNYSKKSLQDVEKRFKPEFVAYIKYLEENEKQLDYHEKAVYRCLRAWLAGDGERKTSDLVCKVEFEGEKDNVSEEEWNV